MSRKGNLNYFERAMLAGCSESKKLLIFWDFPT